MSASISPTPKYKVGQAVYCLFPFADDEGQSKDRPAIILGVIIENNKVQYQVAKLTKTNQTGRFKGIWINTESKKGKTLGLSFDSFIHLQQIISVPEFAIRRLMGNCSFMDEIKIYCSDNGIQLK